MQASHPRSRRRWIWRLIFAISLAYLFALTFILPNPTVTDEPLSYQAFTNTHHGSIESLPPSAHKIRFATSSVGLGGRALLYRFDAPVADCIAYGEGLIATNGLTASKREAFRFPMRTDFTSSHDPVDIGFLRHYGLSEIEWFDVETITSGFRGFGPPSGLSRLWIDTVRGRVYYYWTD
jgi:hypothetical protein